MSKAEAAIQSEAYTLFTAIFKLCPELLPIIHFLENTYAANYKP